MTARLHSVLSFLVLMPLVSWLLLNIVQAGSVFVYRIAWIVITIFLFLGIRTLYYSLENRIPSERNLQKVSLVLFFPAILGVGLLLFSAILFPHGMDDAWLMWNLKGRHFTLAFLQGFDLTLIQEAWNHSDYPHYLPLQLAFLAIPLGFWSTWIPVLLHIIYYLIIYTIFLDVYFDFRPHRKLGAFMPRNRNDFALLIFWGTVLAPGLLKIFADQCADLPLATIALATIHLLFRIRKQSKKPVLALLIIGLYCGTLFQIKNEGAIVGFIILLSTPIMLDLNRKTIKYFVYIILGSLIPVLLLIAFKYSAPQVQPYEFSFDAIWAMILDYKRYKLVAVSALGWLIIGAALLPVAAMFAVAKLQPVALKYFIPLLLVYALYNAFYLVTPLAQEWHLVSSYDRLMMHLFPAWMIVALFTLHPDFNKKSRVLNS